MAQDTSVEAARARIQRLVEEIAALSRREMRSEEYFQEFLTRAVQATDARGGAVWLVAPRAGDGRTEFQLAAQVELESSLFQQDEQQHAFLLKQIAETVQGKKPIVAAAQTPQVDPNSLQAQMEQMQGAAPQRPAGGNKTKFPFFHVPLTMKDQVLGVLQMWLQPYVTQANYGEFVTFLSTLAANVEQHFHSRRLGNLVLENQRLQQVLKFTGDIAGSLDPLEVARLAANYGRDLIGCDRCAVATLRGDRWSIDAISGQEVVEKKSAMVKAMVAFINAHANRDAFLRKEKDAATGLETLHPQLIILNRKALLAAANGAALPAGETSPEAIVPAETPANAAMNGAHSAALAYLEHSQMASAALAPMFDAQQELTGVLFAESSTEGFFEGAGKESGGQRLAEWLAVHSGKALQAAKDYRSLPLLSVTSRLRTTHRALTGRKRSRHVFRLVVFLIIFGAVALYPKMVQVDGNCSLLPTERRAIVTEIGGRVDRVLVGEGRRVAKGDPIAQIDTKRLELELESARQEGLRSQAEADRLMGIPGGEGVAASKVAQLQVSIAEKTMEKLRKDIDAATLRSPIEGVIMTKDLELRAGEALQPGSPFAEVAALDRWELQVEISEKKVGKLEREMGERKGETLPVNFILYSQSAHKLSSTLTSSSEISSMAYPREQENVFIVTLKDIDAPPVVKKDFRPGLTGRAKINLHREPLIMWFFKGVVDWIRLKFV